MAMVGALHRRRGCARLFEGERRSRDQEPSRDGYIEQERYGEITLTPAGKEYGEHILMRHRVLRAFLIDALGVDEEAANREACMMEHAISEDTMDKWIAWYEENYGPVSETPASTRM